MTNQTSRRAVQIISGAAILALTALGAFAATGAASNDTYAPREGFSRSLGSKIAVGFFEDVAGKCAVTLLVAETARFEQGEPASASRIRLSLSPAQSFELSSVETQGLTMRCGADGTTLSIGAPPAASM